tara:strand:- start:337 stop:951 length:615 start_codon:yes stop_codon:yes gene_type:complete
MNIELWRNVKIVDTSATATKRLIKMIAVGLVTAILLGTTIGHTKTMDNTEIEYLKKRIKKHEGYRELPYNLEYKTTDGKVVKENFSTAGYGHVIQEGEVEPEGGYTKAYWEGVFEKDFKNAHDGALKLLGDSNVHPTAVGIVTEMIYQMGYNGVSKFTNTLKLIKDGRYQDASIEMLDSNWAKQTEGRAIDLSKIMKSLEANIQ